MRTGAGQLWPPSRRWASVAAAAAASGEAKTAKSSSPRAVDLVPRRSGDGLPQEAADVGEDGLPLVAELARQPSRALDVREEEGDGARSAARAYGRV